MIELRSAVASDAPEVARIYVDSWNEGFGHLMGTRSLTADLVERWTTDLKNPKVEWVVAEIDGEVVGFVGVGPSRDPLDPSLGEVDTIAVDPRRWRQGIGRALMEDALRQLRERFQAAILWTPSDYDRGHRFYRAMGWRPDDRSRSEGSEVAFRHALG